MEEYVVILAIRTLCLFGFVAIAVSAAPAGTIRYQLPELLGEYRFEGFEDFYGPNAHEKATSVPLPERYLSASVRLVASGTITPGKAQGDDILRESGEFDYVGGHSVYFAHDLWNGFNQINPAGLYDGIDLHEQDGQFRIEFVHPDPFSLPPESVMPCLGCNRPPISDFLLIGLNLLPFANTGPPLFQPVPHIGVDSGEGLEVTVPIIATVTEAYLEISGNAIVPEPSTVALTVLGLAAIVVVRVGRIATRRPHSADGA